MRKINRKQIAAALLLLAGGAFVGGGVALNPLGAMAETQVLYSVDFENLQTSATEDEIYGATALAGGATRSIVEEGLEGNSAKVIYTFFEDGGWQHSAAYFNENNMSVVMAAEKEYAVSFEFSTFGKVTQAVGLFQQVGSGASEAQIFFNANGEPGIIDNSGMFDQDASSVVLQDGVWKVNMKMYGKGGKFKFLMNMQSSDAAGANSARDTGMYFDNFTVTTEKEEVIAPDYLNAQYKTKYSENFNGVAEDVAGGHAIWQATEGGFAGNISTMTTETGAINDSRALKVVYDFWPTANGGWQKEQFYLDSGKTSTSVAGKIYRFNMKVKPFGKWDQFVLGFQSEKSSIPNSHVFLKSDGTISYENGILDAKAVNTDGVYDVTVWMYGNGGYIFNFFNMLSSDADGANLAKDTGVYLDDYTFAEQRNVSLPNTLNKKAHFYNKAEDVDFTVHSTFAKVTSVKLGDTTLATDAYTLENGLLTVKKSAFATLAAGNYDLTVVNGSASDTVKLKVDHIHIAPVYENDFSSMIDLGGDQAAKEAFYQHSWMDPATFNVYTEDVGDNRVIKFVGSKTTENMEDIFQTNPREGRMNMLGKGKWHTVQADFKPVEASILGIRGLVFDQSQAAENTELTYMELDLVNGTRVDDGPHSEKVSWRIDALGEGWYRVRISFYYDDSLLASGSFADTASAYFQFKAASETANSAWYMDNISALTETIPFAEEGGNTNYDLASGKTPYYLINLYQTVYSITSITVDGTAVPATAYTTETTPNGSTRLQFTKEYCDTFALDTQHTVAITTSKGNVIELQFAVVNTQPTLPTQPIVYDKAVADGVTFDADLRGQTIKKITLNDVDLRGNEYQIPETGKLTFKHGYLNDLAAGEYVFTLTTSSDAKATFTITVTDTTPVFSGTPVYEKTSGGDLVIDVELFGKAITAVTLGETVLTAEQYSYADGKLTVKGSTLANLPAAIYPLTVTTVGAQTVQVEVRDVPPQFSGSYTATVNKDLVLTVDVKGKDILSITIDGLALRAEEYAYADGKLTIKGAVLSELAAGERTLVLTTEGGEATLTFRLKADGAKEESGCNNVVLNTLAPLTLLGGAALVCKKKRK